MTIRWLGPIGTDLSVTLKDQNAESVRWLIMKSEDDPWAKVFCDIIVEDFVNLQYNHSTPERIKVRELAVHAANRFHYYEARTRLTDPAGHRMLDSLLMNNTPMEGCVPPQIHYKDGDQDIYEVIGMYNFDAAVQRPAMHASWLKYGYPMVMSNRYG